MIPLRMMSEIKRKHNKYTSGMDKTYEGFSKLLVEMAYEKNYDRRAAKSRGDTDMELMRWPRRRRSGNSSTRPDRLSSRQMTMARMSTTLMQSGSSMRKAFRTSSTGLAHEEESKAKAKVKKAKAKAKT